MPLVQDGKGILVFLCDQCRQRSPVIVENRPQWRCDHNGVTIFKDRGRRVLRYDQDSVQRNDWPKFNNDNAGPYRTRAFTGPSSVRSNAGKQERRFALVPGVKFRLS